MHIKIEQITVNLDALAFSDTVNRDHPVSHKTTQALRLVFGDSMLDPVYLYDDEAEAFRAFMASKPEIFVDILKGNAPKPAQAKAEPAAKPEPPAPAK